MQEHLDLLEKDLKRPVFQSKPVTALTTETSVQKKEEKQERLMIRKWFQPNSNNIPWSKKIIWVIGVLRRTVVCDWCFDNEPPHRLRKRQSQTTVLLGTPVTQMIFFNQGNDWYKLVLEKTSELEKLGMLIIEIMLCSIVLCLWVKLDFFNLQDLKFH